MLRAFWQYNDVFEIQLFNSFLGVKHHEALDQAMPLCAWSLGAGMWL
jgi:hypothetical protein